MKEFAAIVQKKRKTEINFINGYVAREDEHLGIPMSYNMVVTRLIKIIEQTYEYQF